MVFKACKDCKALFEGSTCTNCGSNNATDTFKGKVIVINPEESEVAKNLKISKKGTYVVKLG